MLARMASPRSPIWLLASIALLGCQEPGGPYPTVTIRLHGRVTSAGTAPLPIAGASVTMLQGLGEVPETLAHATSDEAGTYRLSYTFTSVCEPQDNTTNWIEASAEGYETASAFTLEAGDFSDPPIYCTSEPQVINLSLQPLSAD